MSERVPSNGLMEEPRAFRAALLVRRILFGLLLGLLGFLCLLVLKPFFAPIVWAAILAYASWPAYRQLRKPLRKFDATAATLMTVLVTCSVVLPLVWLLILVRSELADAYRQLAGFLSQGPYALPPMVRDIPWLGARLQEGMDHYTTDPAALARDVTGWLRNSAAVLAAMLGDVGRNVGKLLLTLATLFFFYRDGDTIVQQTRTIVKRFFGDRLDRYVDTAGTMTRAVLYGILITAFAQGLIAGIGYWIVGLEAPVLLGTLTGALSALPLFGTALVWAPIGLNLLMTGPIWKGIVLLTWGALLVHPTDNLLRPLLISNATRVPFLLVMLGAIGGLAAFGLVGVFVGPVLLGIAMAIWREWAA